MVEMKQVSKTVRILDLIASIDGMRFTDIQRALWEMSHTEPFTRELRGYWCTNLLGGMYYHAGILNFYCEKGADGLWRTKRTHGEKPWQLVKPRGMF